MPKGSDPNGVVLTLSKDALPGWVTGVVVVAAMVPAAGFWINHSMVVLASTVALVLGFLRRVPVGKGPVFAGLIAGELVVGRLTFVDTHLAGTVDVGLIGLGVNVVVLTLAAVVRRQTSSVEAA